MLRKRASQVGFFLLIVALLTCVFNTQLVRASGTIYIRADGSIDPPEAPIQRNVGTYTFTGDIDGSIIVERDNIVVDGAGHTLQGTGSETGIDLSGRTNVAIQNIKIKTFDSAIYLSSSNHITILGTNIADSSDGIWISDSSSNRISGNNITANVLEGIYILASSDNSISGNNITANTFDGVYLSSSSNNTISGNNIANNGWGVTSYYSSDNRIFHNNFISNFEQADSESSADVWDNGYPSGGNYWSNYAGEDLYSGPGQNVTGSDGIGDEPCNIDEYNQDRYPLMKPYVLGDLDRDGDVDEDDLWYFCARFIDYYKIHVKDPLCDFDNNCKIDEDDLWTMCGAFMDYWKHH
jgi:parallel beta-helix repeat protein